MTGSHSNLIFFGGRLFSPFPSFDHFDEEEQKGIWCVGFPFKDILAQKILIDLGRLADLTVV